MHNSIGILNYIVVKGLASECHHRLIHLPYEKEYSLKL